MKQRINLIRCIVSGNQSLVLKAGGKNQSKYFSIVPRRSRKFDELRKESQIKNYFESEEKRMRINVVEV